MDGWTLNTSRGGIRIIAEAPLELGEEIHVRVGDDGPLRPGRVVWVQDEPDGCIAGIAWLDVPRDAHGVLTAPGDEEPPKDPQL